MENDNLTGISELEKTKWMISRIDMLHKNLADAFTSDMKTYETTANKSISKIKEWRNYLLSPIGAGLAVLIGSTTVYNFDLWVFTTILSILAVIGLIIFVIFTKLASIVENVYSEIEIMLTDGIGNLVTSQGFITSVVADLSITNFENIKNYFVFSQILICAVMYSLSNQLKELAEKYRILKDFKNFLEEQSQIYRKDIDHVTIYFQVFDRTKLLHPELLKFVDETLKDFKPK